MQNGNSLARRVPDYDADAIYFGEHDDGYASGYYGASAATGGEKHQIAEFIALLKKRWYLIALLVLIVTSAVIIYEAQKPDYFTAVARVQVNNEVNPAAGGSQGSSIVLNQGNDPAYFTTQLQILEGSGMLRRVVKTLDLENNPTFFRPDRSEQLTLSQNVMRMFGLYSPPRRADIANAGNGVAEISGTTPASTTDLDSQAEQLAPYVGFLKGGLEINPVTDRRTQSPQTRLIEIEFTHFNPQIATKVANAIADTYVLQNLERKVESNSNASDFLQKRVAELQSEIRSGEERLINYAKNHQILNLDSAQNTVVSRLSDLNSKLSAAENDRISAEAALRAAMANPMRSATAENQDARTSALETQLSTLKQQLDQLKTEYTDEWPEVQKLKLQIAGIETELRTNRKRATDTKVAGLEQTYREALNRERELRTNFESQRDAVLNQNEAAINYRIIQQEIDTNKSLLDNLLQRSRETEVVLNGTPNNVHVVDRALVPRAPEGPQRTKNVILAFLVSMLGGVGLVFAMHWLDDRVKPSDDLEALLGIPVIGLIPGVSNGFARKILSGRVARLGNKRIRGEEYQLDRFEKPLMVEAYHQLRTSLLLSTAGGAPQLLLVTSGEQFEGKTLTSLNLAKSLAQLDHKVLLIDADLRCPKMHTLMDVSNAAGLSNLLTTKKVDQSVIKDVIHKEVAPGLDLMTSGPTVPNPANLFASNEMQTLLKDLRDVYTHIVIDSPPVLYFADSVILSTAVDAVMLIARTNHSSRGVLARAQKRMQDVRANVIGVVINDVPVGNYEYKNNVYYHQLADEAAAAEAGAGYLKLDKE
jgi:succinoglycan biosynthesis transport protein ExoP